MIAEYENGCRTPNFDSPRQYALTQQHKHLKEMKAITGLEKAPVFCPIVSDYYSGIAVTVPLFAENLSEGKTVNDIIEVYKNTYTTDFVSYKEDTGNDAMLCANALRCKDNMEIFVQGNEDRILLIARFDNLGKGASGAAVECMNIMLGLDPKTGLSIGE